MISKCGIHRLILVSVSILLGATAGGCIVYNCVALRYRRQYESLCLIDIESRILLARKLRSGQTTNVIERFDAFLGQSALGLGGEITHVRGVPHVLWAIKKYYGDYKLITDPELESLFKQIPDEEPDETVEMIK